MARCQFRYSSIGLTTGSRECSVVEDMTCWTAKDGRGKVDWLLDLTFEITESGEDRAKIGGIINALKLHSKDGQL